jgi:hypothetical protein
MNLKINLNKLRLHLVTLLFSSQLEEINYCSGMMDF